MSPSAAPGRRTVLLGGLAAIGGGVLGTGVLGGCSAADRGAGVTNSVTPVGTRISGRFYSRYRRAETGWTILRPPGHTAGRLPVLVALHGRGGDHTSVYSQLDLDRYLAAAVAAGTRPFAIAAADGGQASYWHPRLHTDPSGMIVHEFLPLLARHGLDTGRIGLFGWSMGGYGALYLATVLGPQRVACAVAESPAIWRHSYQVVAGSFDSPADFRRHALWHRLHRLHGIPLLIDCGASDGFAPITRELRAELSPPRPAGGIQPGGHNDAYWRSQAPAQLRWVGRQFG